MNIKNKEQDLKQLKSKRAKIVLLTGIVAVLTTIIYLGLAQIFSFKYESVGIKAEETNEFLGDAPKPFVAKHLETPEPLKALYMTSWVAGTKSLRDPLIRLVDETELNAVVIDIKDDTGRISFEVFSPELKEVGSEDIRINDIRSFIAELHNKNIYVIGRVSSFQDPFMVELHPEWAVRRASDGGIWKDRKGLTWIDPGARAMWNYLVLVGKEAYDSGFDEINYDYIRFPSDGNMTDISYPYSEGLIKSDVIEEYFKYLTEGLRKKTEGDNVGVPIISVDLFGMTTVAFRNFDLNIGQVFSKAFPYFDYISPMVYPSHYPPYFEGYPDPNKVPYEVVKISMDGAVLQAKNYAYTASSSPETYINKIRPWLQDFDYGGNYDVAEVHAQIKAVYDAGLSSWMIWDASNKYTKEAYIRN